MKGVSKKINLNRLCYELVIIAATIDVAFSNTTVSFYSDIHSVLLGIVLAFSVLCILTKKYSVIFLFMNMLVLLFGVFSYQISGNTDLMVSLLLIMLIHKIDVDTVLNLIYRIRLVIFAGVVTASIIGILPIGNLFAFSSEKGILLGYGHSNTFAGNAGILILLMLAVNRHNLKKYHYLIALIADGMIYFVSHARVSLVIIPLVLFSYLCKKEVSKRRVLKGVKYVFPLALIVNFGLIAMKILQKASGITELADTLMNGRVTLAAMNLMYYPVTLLGQRVDISVIASQNLYYALDNGYTYLLIHYGLIGLCIFSTLFQLAMISCQKKEDIVLCSIVTVFIIWSMYEGMMISASSNFTLLFAIGSLHIRNKKSDYNKIAGKSKSSV